MAGADARNANAECRWLQSLYDSQTENIQLAFRRRLAPTYAPHGAFQISDRLACLHRHAPCAAGYLRKLIEQYRVCPSASAAQLRQATKSWVFEANGLSKLLTKPPLPQETWRLKMPTAAVLYLETLDVVRLLRAETTGDCR